MKKTIGKRIRGTRYQAKQDIIENVRIHTHMRTKVLIQAKDDDISYQGLNVSGRDNFTTDSRPKKYLSQRSNLIFLILKMFDLLKKYNIKTLLKI
jgi:hypothetical protein